MDLKHGSIADWIAAFVFDRKAQNMTPGTLQYYQVKLGKFRRWCDGQEIDQVDQLTPNDLRRFMAWLQESGHNSAGCHAFYRAVKTLLRWVWAELEPDKANPIDRVKAPKVESVILEPVSVETVAAMLATCTSKGFTDLRDKAIILTLLDSGLRAGELLSLNLADVDLIRGDVLVRVSKSRKARTVFVGQRTRRAIRSYLLARSSSDQALFVSDNGNRLAYFGLVSMIRRRAAAAGVEAPALHSFRRAFALSMLRSGVDLVTLSRLLGHSGLGVLSRYLSQVVDDLALAHRRASPADKL